MVDAGGDYARVEGSKDHDDVTYLWPVELAFCFEQEELSDLSRRM